MLATYPQFSPQTLMPSPYGAAPFGNSSFGYEPGLGGNPFAQGHLSWQGQGQGLPQGLQGQGPYAVAQQLVIALGQLAHQIAIQSVVSQHIGAALQHLTQQIQTQTAGMRGFGLGQPYGQQFVGASGGAYPGFGGQGQPAWQTWGGPRTQTIQ